MQNSLTTPKTSPFKVKVGKLGLDRTIIPDAAVQKVYFEPEDYFKLGTIAHFCNMTVDELIRTACKKYIDECDN